MKSIFMILSILVFGILTIITQGDPCFDYNILDSADDPRRSVANSYGQYCDNTLESEWYRIISNAGERMPTKCIVGGYRCGTTSSVWMNGSYPISNETNSVTACAASSNGNCCAYSYQIKVKNCTDYLVYNLVPVAPCFQAYCFGIELPCPTGETSENGFSPGCEPNSTTTTIRPKTITSIIPYEDSTILETTETKQLEEISTTSLATEHISNLPQQDEKAESPNIMLVVGLTVPAVFLLIVIAVIVVVLRRKPNCLMNTMCPSSPIYEETSSENVPRSNLQIESSSQTQTTVQSTKVRVRVQANERVFVNGNERATGTAISAEFTEEEINFTKMGMIALNIFADVLYDLLKPDKPHLRPRCDCDITYLYSEHRNLNKHVPSNSNHRQYPHGPWGGCWQDFKNTDIAIGDDIERIRLTRNELQHSQLFKLDDMRFNELSNISSDLLKRFDRHNTPTKLYTDRLMEILAKSISKEEVKSIENKISGMTIEVEIEY